MPILMIAMLPALGGCWWMSGPWTGRDKIEDKFEDIEISMLREDVIEILGEPSEIKYTTGENQTIAEGTQEGWLLYKYDYAGDPLLIAIELDVFGLVTEKHFDDEETVAKLVEARAAEKRLSYPGGPQRRFQELVKKKQRGEEK